MQVLGDLIELPENSSDLPLPWWHRACLGLLTPTTVYVGFAKRQKRPVPDLIVSVLDPIEWKRMARFEVRDDERFGVLYRIFKAIAPADIDREKAHNVALAESVTIEDGTIYHATVIAELRGSVSEAIDEIKNRMKAENIPIERITASPLTISPPNTEWVTTGRVDRGWIRQVNWKGMLAQCYGDAANNVDLGRAVVSADTDNRLLRFVFPKKGAFAVTIDHFDRPGALREILNVFEKRQINVLSALLRRGGAQPNRATLVGVFEPDNDLPSPNREEMTLAFAQIGPEYSVQLKQFNNGRKARETLMPTRFSEILVQPSEILTPLIERFRRETQTRNRIFLSQRWDDRGSSDAYSKKIAKMLESCKCKMLEARPEPNKDPFLMTFLHVSAKIWLAKAGIVLLAQQESRADGEELSLNIAHELGFFQGQGKPVLILVEKDLLNSSASFERFANIRGVEVTGFDRENDDKLMEIIQKWVNIVVADDQ